MLVENADECMVLDNEALYDICFHTFKLSNPQLLLGTPNEDVWPGVSELMNWHKYHYNILKQVVDMEKDVLRLLNYEIIMSIPLQLTR